MKLNTVQIKRFECSISASANIAIKRFGLCKTHILLTEIYLLISDLTKSNW